jgi:hypothetical protein
VGILRPQSLYSRGKILQYPSHRRLGGREGRSGSGDDRKNSCPRRKSNPARPASVVTPRNDVVGYKRFGEACCLHVQGNCTLDIASYHVTNRRQNPEDRDLNLHRRETFKIRQLTRCYHRRDSSILGLFYDAILTSEVINSRILEDDYKCK